jgi:hypothetical protein
MIRTLRSLPWELAASSSPLNMSCQRTWLTPRMVGFEYHALIDVNMKCNEGIG